MHSQCLIKSQLHTAVALSLVVTEIIIGSVPEPV